MTRGWRMLVAAMLIGAAHFGLCWVTSSVFGSGGTARTIVLVLTAIAILATAAVGYRIFSRREDDPLDGWFRSLGLLGCALTALAILWQGLPALLS